MNDDEMLATMRRSLTGITESMTDVRLERPVGTIHARARRRRLRRSLAGAGTGGLALGIGFALAAGGGSPAGARPVHVNLDAWSVNTLSSGLVYVDVRELQNPVLLRQTLAEAGVPAIVTFGEFCTGPSGSNTVDLGQILGKTAAGGRPRLTINPAGIPHGSELSIGIVSAWKSGVQGLDASFGVVQAGAHLTCGQPSANPTGAGKQGPPNPGGTGAVKTGIGNPTGAGKQGPPNPGGTGAVKTGIGS
jgi:hypothetical protein